MKKVLITDDQAGWIKFHSEIVFKILGNDTVIQTCLSAKEAYSKLLENTNNPYDYIITDMQMEDDFAPKMAGEWLIEQVQNIPAFYKTKIIIISASPKIKFIAETYNVDYIPKHTATVTLEPYEKLLIN